MVDLTANTGERRPRILACFKGEADTDDFQGVGQENRGDTCEGA